MADDTDIELDDEVSTDEQEEAPVEVAKTNLTKRRIIDNLLDERRLKKQLNEYDFDFE
jgi:hypothetical protein